MFNVYDPPLEWRDQEEDLSADVRIVENKGGEGDVDAD